MRESKNNNNLLMVLMAVITIAALIFAFMFRGPKPTVDVTSIEDQLISFDTAKKLEAEYLNTRYAVINRTLGYEDARDYWFSLNDLKTYISYIEENAPEGSSNLGIRIYNAAYPEGFDERVKSGYSTVYLVPTALKASVGNGFAPPQNGQNHNLTNLKSMNYSQCCYE